ncbi:ras association domain-containing protein 4a [Brienomyrus brachyistius]|uniref:ras association domain-containing protein 4a n=1 Tax=Brienomyrus brachyistius TaxID=42636 RepID=UPI0020B25070|nr:ras association domain-containing protein 4a [Brienomyrus brachyistius]XP_048864399.1 ras association domain-containing protein 4a [Brienomyrus brachyistius]XP_048864400.1 ras association domain-containing protein 4a [Brienomyrus brachyistius]XP_048864401.1 ras association domain-containing protein 4a [Brienomyrus brachyistius]
MEDCHASLVKISKDKVLTRTEMMSLLKTYNCYHEGKSFQLRSREEDGELVIEGLLSISWGLRRPIRLQMQDDNERFQHSSVGIGGEDEAKTSSQKQTSLESNNNESSDASVSEDETPQLMRTRSDASFMGIQRRSRRHSQGEMQRMKKHRFSINGHFYNHKTSVFIPTYGSVTNVRVKSTMTTEQVLRLLLNKFRVENKLEEFVLYMVHESGEKTKLRDTDYPLISRLLHGPCEKIAKMFLMEADLGEEVTYDVAQYIKFEMPMLDSFVEKLKEEEDREISKLTRKYSALKSMILQQIEDIAESSQHC